MEWFCFFIFLLRLLGPQTGPASVMASNSLRCHLTSPEFLVFSWDLPQSPQQVYWNSHSLQVFGHLLGTWHSSRCLLYLISFNPEKSYEIGAVNIPVLQTQELSHT